MFSLSTFLLAHLSFIYMTLFTMWTEKTSIKGEIRRVLPLSEVVKWGDEPPSAWCPGREKLGYQRFFPACTASPTCTRVHCLRAKVGPFLEGGRVEKGHLYALCYLFKNNHQKNGAHMWLADVTVQLPRMRDINMSGLLAAVRLLRRDFRWRSYPLTLVWLLFPRTGLMFKTKLICFA